MMTHAEPVSAASIHTLKTTSQSTSSGGEPKAKSRKPPVMGIVGGGQLARMLARAAAPLGVQVAVLDQVKTGPAGSLASVLLEGSSGDVNALEQLARVANVTTFENEFVDAALVKQVEEAGHIVRPTAETLRLVQDKLVQKQTLAAHGLPLPPFREVASPEEIRAAGEEFGWPLVLKQRRNGYDGKGNTTIRSAGEIEEGWRVMQSGRTPLYVEAFCRFRMELATIITRSATGEVAQYPLVETVQQEHICHLVKAPAMVPPEIAAEALEIAAKAVAAVGGIGSTGVEMFLTEDNRILVNELAPRVHNSGHYTIEGCVCSQFENHVRAVLGWPLGSTALRAPAAVMVNLLSPHTGPGWPRGMEKALAVAGAHVHLYGKARGGVRRKMGHVTALGETMEAALRAAQEAADWIEWEGK